MKKPKSSELKRKWANRKRRGKRHKNPAYGNPLLTAEIIQSEREVNVAFWNFLTTLLKTAPDWISKLPNDSYAVTIKTPGETIQ